MTINKGEFVFLVGPSGSGKSSFLRLILREERPHDGRIMVAGNDLAKLTHWKLPAPRRKHVDQNRSLALVGIAKPRRFIKRVVPEVLDLVGLEGKHDRMPDELSGGEQQRVRSEEHTSELQSLRQL